MTHTPDIGLGVEVGQIREGACCPEVLAHVAVLLNGEPGKFIDTKLAMDDLAYEVLLDTGIRIQPLPIWQSEWDNPDQYSNPALLLNIQHEGIAL